MTKFRLFHTSHDKHSVAGRFVEIEIPVNPIEGASLHVPFTTIFAVLGSSTLRGEAQEADANSRQGILISMRQDIVASHETGREDD